MSLTPKQAAFVEEYLVDLNATQAAIRAGYSERTAGVIGCENLAKPKIAEAIREAANERSERVKITQDDVLRGLLEEATHEGTAAAHSQARIAAWSWIGKHLAMFRDRLSVEHSGEIKGGVLIVPMATGEIDWAALAQEHQAALVGANGDRPHRNGKKNGGRPNRLGT